ncbi:MAG: hypothetical protein ACOYS2_03410 [Patescibacteria group bacterium]
MSAPKKIFIASLVIFLTALAFWGIYFLVFKKTSPSNDPSSESSLLDKKSADSSSEKPGKLVAISQDSVISPILKDDGVTIIYYSSQNGQVFQIDLEGNNKKTVSDKNLIGLKKVLWSPNQTKVLSDFGDQGIKFWSYSEKLGGDLGKNIKSANFQNDQKIVYAYFDQKTNQSSLNVADWDGKNWKRITDLSFYGQNIIPVPRSGLVSFWNFPGANFETNLFTVPIIGGEKKLLFSGKFGADYLWNPSGSQLLVSHSNEKNGHKTILALLDSQGQNYQDLGLPTFVSKCVWGQNGKTIYYALPGSMPGSAVLPDDYIQGKFKTTDTFWKVDTTTGKKERLIDLSEIGEKIDAENLFLNSNESFLFFVNRYDGKIWRIRL